MSLSVIAFVLSILLAILAISLLIGRKKSKKLNNKLETETKNHLYLINLFKEIQSSIVSEKNLEQIVNIITSSLDKNYPYSTLSSGFIKDSKLIFKSQVKEIIARAFIDSIKNNMQSAIGISETEENITGVALNDLINSSIKSAADVKLVIDQHTVAIINISSTTEALYTQEDLKTLATIGELVSNFLTKIELLLSVEKSKSLAMIDSFSEGIFMIDREIKLIAMNDSAENILSIHKDIPTINDIFSSLPNTYNFKNKIEAVMQEKKTIQENDIPIKDKIFNIIISPVIEINTQDLLGVSVLLHDITLEKSLSQMKKDFTNVMVHELRSPLTAIKASSEFLTSKADLTDYEKERLTQMISESSKKMLDEISLILDSAKMDAGLFTIRKTESDLKKLITDRIAVFTPVAQEKTISITVDIDENLSKFSFDPVRIDEVINNLLSNSLKFTPTHGNINVSAHQMLGKVTVSIKDTGAGIPKDKQHLLFAKFQQAPTDGVHQGTGLGLYVVKGVVEAHGGTVSLESEVGAGTSISFTLPISVEKSTTPSSPPPKQALAPQDNSLAN